MTIQLLKEKVLRGEDISREEAIFLSNADLKELSCAADDIRKAFCDDDFDMCSVISIKGGRCPENCKYCAQASCSTTPINTFPLIDTDKIVGTARLRESQGIRHFGLVSSGKRLNDREVDKICESIKALHDCSDIKICASMGLLKEEHFIKLKEAGVVRIHNNLETSRSFFPKVCTSHTYEDKLETIYAAKKAGLEICSGGIIGIGESMEDRIDMMLELRNINPISVPVNLLDPVLGTPLGDMPVLSEEEVKRTIAVCRFILPHTYVRLAAGRDYIEDTGLSCFLAGSNATITGDMLTVMGISVEQDLKTIKELGYKM